MHRLLLFAILIEFLVTAVHAQDEPTYEGRTVSQWVGLLQDSADEEERRSAAEALGKIGPSARNAVPALIEALENDADSKGAWTAANALAKIGPDAEAAVPALIRALQRDEDESGAWAAAHALTEIAPRDREVISALVKMSETGPPHMRWAVVVVLPNIGPGVKEVGPAVRKVLIEDEDQNVRMMAATSLGMIARSDKEEVPALIKALEEDTDAGVRSTVAGALGSIGPDVDGVVSALIKTLQRDSDGGVRSAAASALGEMGTEARTVVSALVQALEEDTEGSVRRAAAQALSTIAGTVQDAEVVTALPMLKEVSQSLGEFRQDRANVERTIQALSAIRDLREMEKRNKFWSELEQTYSRFPYVFWASGYIILCLATCLTLLLLRPLWILRVNQWMRTHAALRLPESFGGWGLPSRYAILIAFFEYHPRVLDAWVDKYISKASQNFSLLPSVVARSVHVPLPVNCDTSLHSEFTPASLRDRFSRDAWLLLIVGEGGAGKTSLAFQIARWAMAEERRSRPCTHRMIPILIDQLAGGQSVIQAIHGHLVSLLELHGPLQDGLLDKLLRRRRLLVIVDHLSEMHEDARSKIRPVSAGFPAKALIVTSRREETELFGNVPKMILRLIRIEGNQLSEFVGAYLTQLGKRGLFKDPEYFSGCSRLSEMVGDRNVTVLIAKLFADQMIRSKESGSDDVPENIPHLMLEYLNDVNRSRTDEQPDNRTVQSDMRCVSWLSLKERLLPGPVDRNAVIKDLDGEGKEERLAYLEKNLALIRTVGVDENRLRIALDPLAEYLAAMEYVDKYKGNTKHWDYLMEHARDQPDAPESIKGFLLALRDCCFATEHNIPGDLVESIERLVGMEV